MKRNKGKYFYWKIILTHKEIYTIEKPDYFSKIEYKKDQILIAKSRVGNQQILEISRKNMQPV